MIKKKIKKIKKQFKKYNIDGYVIPKNDEFFSEYSNKDRLNLYQILQDQQVMQ